MCSKQNRRFKCKCVQHYYTWQATPPCTFNKGDLEKCKKLAKGETQIILGAEGFFYVSLGVAGVFGPFLWGLYPSACHVTRINELKTLTNMHHENVNINLMVENEIQTKSGIMINVGVSVKNIYLKKIIFGILLYLVAKMVLSKYNWQFSGCVWWNYRCRRKKRRNYSNEF